MSSILQAEIVVLRALETFYFNGRRVGPYSQHRGLFVASRAEAIRLVDRKLAKMPGEKTRRQLIDCGSR